jgi:hypothetical protein
MKKKVLKFEEFINEEEKLTLEQYTKEVVNILKSLNKDFNVSDIINHQSFIKTFNPNVKFSPKKVAEHIQKIMYENLNEGKFTFKTEHPTGRYRSFEDDNHIIKFEGKEVGSIEANKPFKINLMIKKDDKHNDSNPNCSWKHIYFKREFETLDSAKEWLNQNIDKILKEVTLHKL